MAKLESDPRLTRGEGLFPSLIEWGRRVALAVNPLVDLTATHSTQIAELQSGPAFSAYSNTVQGWPVGGPVGGLIKINCNVEEFDTANAYDNVTNFRFNPKVAGYYQINGQWLSNFATNVVGAYIMKNGAAHKRGNWLTDAAGPVNMGPVVSALIFMNGTTDYVELFAYSNVDSLTYVAEGIDCYFQGFLARRA